MNAGAKALVSMLLAGLSNGAVAAWVAIGATEIGTVYVEPNTILKLGDTAKMWHLVDFNSVQTKASGKRYLSEKWHYEYDCKEARARILSFLSQSANMGAGVMVEGDWHPQKWEPVSPDGVLNHVRKFACSSP